LEQRENRFEAMAEDKLEQRAGRRSEKSALTARQEASILTQIVLEHLAMIAFCCELRLASGRLVVLGRFRDSIRKDSILLAIFAREQEDSIQKSKNRFVSKLEPVF
jgi:hypothetical protein